MIAPGKALVLGATGFLGSHVTQQLCAAGRDVRVLVRPGSDTRGLAGLVLERRVGDALDPAALRAAMDGCATVFHCVVDTRAWLHDPAPLFRVNVQGLGHALDAALATGIRRYVFTSTIGTIGHGDGRRATEHDAIDPHEPVPAYVRSRLEAERLFLAACRARGLPGVALCVGNTSGAGDWAPTPHGKLVQDAARGRVIEMITRLIGVATTATTASLECSRRMGDMDSAKARIELGWTPRPVTEAIAAAVAFHLRNARPA